MISILFLAALTRTRAECAICYEVETDVLGNRVLLCYTPTPWCRSPCSQCKLVYHRVCWAEAIRESKRKTCLTCSVDVLDKELLPPPPGWTALTAARIRSASRSRSASRAQTPDALQQQQPQQQQQGERLQQQQHAHTAAASSAAAAAAVVVPPQPTPSEKVGMSEYTRERRYGRRSRAPSPERYPTNTDADVRRAQANLKAVAKARTLPHPVVPKGTQVRLVPTPQGPGSPTGPHPSTRQEGSQWKIPQWTFWGAVQSFFGY